MGLLKRRGCAVVLLLLLVAAVAVYLSLFWGWASGAGKRPDAETLAHASRVSLWVSAGAFLLAVVVGLVELGGRKS